MTYLPRRALVSSLCLLVVATSPAPLLAADAPAKPLLVLPPGGGAEVPNVSPSSKQVTIARSQDPSAPGAVVTIQPGAEGYPGVSVKPADGAKSWDLSAYGHVEARIVNTGTAPLALGLRVDNAGDWRDNPWNTENLSLKPGAAGTVRVVFGYAFGHKRGYALKPGAVTNVLLFTTKSSAAQSFRIESLAAGGAAGERPPVDPETITVKPAGGALFGGGGDPVDVAKQVVAKGTQAALAAEGGRPSLRVTFPAGAKGEQSAALKPAAGRWNLSDHLEARVQLRNAGRTPVTPRVRLESNHGPTDWAATASPLAPGAAAEVVVPFAAASIWNGEKGTGGRFASNVASAVTITVDGGGADAERVVVVDSIRAALPPAPPPPAWLGKRPPVEGDWTQTFNDDFSGTAIDGTKWRFLGENHWDKASHFSKDNTTVANGVARLRFERKRGHHNDDPKRHQTDYATGYLDTFDRWTQRYGYFESRMKLPTAPGLWPAFWMMPDRGPAAGQWKRQGTDNGGMEFDIMEHLTRWGPHRYNIAMHWDGYGKDHKATGSEGIYVRPDADGFITAGLLWTPGELVFYGNGREVARWKNPRVADVPGLMMFTLPSGGWDNDPLDDARLPDDFVIDYVRVWQRKDLAASGAQPATRPVGK